MSEQTKEWLDHPETIRFLQGLKDKSKRIRFSWFRGMEVTDHDKMYVVAVEDIQRALTSESVIIYDKEEIERADDGFEF